MLRTVTVYPYAVQTGSIDVPEGLTEEEEMEYISDHFDDISLGEPCLDYRGTDFDID